MNPYAAFVRPILCLVGRHDWTSWQTVILGYTYRRECMWCPAEQRTPR